MMLKSAFLLPSCVLLVPTFINKTVMVLLLCLIFIGQSMASMTMFYSMTSMQSMANSKELSSISTTSSHHHMGTMANISACEQDDMTTACSTTSTEECCAQECDCSISGCSTISAFSTGINYYAEIAISSKIVSPSAFIASNTLTSLYRPPILS